MIAKLVGSNNVIVELSNKAGLSAAFVTTTLYVPGCGLTMLI